MSTMDNPFAALLNENKSAIDKSLVERVFLFTLRRGLQKPDSPTSPNGMALICLADVIINDTSSETEMGEELLTHSIFERLMLENTNDYLVPGNNEGDALQTDALLYLYRAYCTNKQFGNQHKERAKDCQIIHSLIITNATTYMRQPDIFPGRPIYEQWWSLLRDTQNIESSLMDLLIDCIHKINCDEPATALATLKGNFYPVLSKIQNEIANLNMITLNMSIFSILNLFVRDKRACQMGELLIDYTTPNPKATGFEYMNTLFGNIFSMSIMPKYQNGPYEFFGDLTLESKHTNPSLWKCMANHQNSLFKLIKQLLVQSTINKQKTLQWIAKCLHANKSRGHLWNNLNDNLETMLQQNASDSFMIGLTSTLLRLCEPLCETNLKVLLVDPTYCAVPEEELHRKSVNIIKAYEETCLLPPIEEAGKRPTAEKFNFITELFFLTHKAYELSYKSSIERFIRIARELHNLQTAYQDVIAADPNSAFAENMLRMLKGQMQQYLCLMNCLMEPENDTAIVKFFEASAIWLTEIALCSPDDYVKHVQNGDFSPRLRHNKNLPIDITFIPNILQCVPECIIDNIVTYLNFTRHIPLEHFMHIYPSSHDALFKMIVLFMGHAELVKNPHLRAKLAESLEVFLPQHDTSYNRNNNSSFLTHVFDTHPDRLKLVRSILNVFVSIEMTGQSVQFEQKFNYRRPMYAIMEYIWTKKEYVEQFQALADEAETNMEAIEPPLFLRFINLLINDAIFLLDESLNNLQQIRQLQEDQTNGEWNNLPENERQQRNSNLLHLGMMTRFDNILGRDTINFLKLLTTKIQSIFCHNSIVDRITAMLNYFLLNLVGPHKEKFKVRDKKEFDFDPAKMVLEICHIYINLSSSDTFCLAVSQDGRSYSSQLFEYAESILIRIGGGLLISEMAEFANKVEKMEKQYKQEQEFIAEAPEEYLDPIMLTLMTDPVILPSSKVTVDRSTIARHLLSDQTDPFNRAPLTMDKVKSNDALKREIDNWLIDKRNSLQKSDNNDSK